MTLLIHNVIRQTPHLASRPQTSAWTLLTPSTSSSTTLLNAAATPAATLQWKIRLKAEDLDGTNVTDKGKYPDLMDFDLSSLPMDMDSFHVHRAQRTPLRSYKI